MLLATVMVSAGVSILSSNTARHPDLSDVQVIIRTTFPGRAPRIVGKPDHLSADPTMLSVPGAKTVRGYSFFGTRSFTCCSRMAPTCTGHDPGCWNISIRCSRDCHLPPRPRLGPDATGVGWIYQYSLVDRTGTQDASQLRALQDWFLKYELKTVPNVAEVAAVGGMVRQYQIVLDPDKLAAYGISHTKVVSAIQRANQEAGGSVLELGEAEYMVRASGYLQSLDDFRKVPLTTTDAGVSVRLGDVARVQVGPEMRRGIGELDGDGEATGGVIVMRSGRTHWKPSQRSR